MIITGMKHCGKTTMGQFLAESAGCPFFDLDELILRLKSHNYNSIRDLYSKEGKSFFQNKEQEAVKKLFSAQAEKYFILSLGGGSIENAKLIEFLKNEGVFLYLRAEKEFIYKRIIRNGIPPFLKQENPEQSFYDLYDKRTPLYEKAADIIIDVFDKPREENQKKVRNILRRQYGW